MDDIRSEKVLEHSLSRANKPRTHLDKYPSLKNPGGNTYWKAGTHMQHDKVGLMSNIQFEPNGWGTQVEGERWIYVGTSAKPSVCDKLNHRQRLHANMYSDINDGKGPANEINENYGESFFM